jgi:hypothetical protein
MPKRGKNGRKRGQVVFQTPNVAEIRPETRLKPAYFRNLLVFDLPASPSVNGVFGGSDQITQMIGGQNLCFGRRWFSTFSSS